MRAARHLPEQRHHAADRQHEADVDLRPFLRRQIDRDERAEPGLHVGDEEDEPVEAAQAAARRVRAARRRAPADAARPTARASGCGAGAAIVRAVRPRAGRVARQITAPAASRGRRGAGGLPSAPSTMTGLALLVFGRGLHLSRVSSSVMTSRLSSPAEVQRIPVDRDLAAADAEKAAEVDDRGARPAVASTIDIDDPAHVLVGGAADVLAEDRLASRESSMDQRRRWSVTLAARRLRLAWSTGRRIGGPETRRWWTQAGADAAYSRRRASAHRKTSRRQQRAAVSAATAATQLPAHGASQPFDDGNRPTRSVPSRFRSLPELSAKNDRDLDLAARARRSRADIVVAVPAHLEVDAASPSCRLRSTHLVEERRQARIAQPDLAALRIEFEAERRPRSARTASRSPRPAARRRPDRASARGRAGAGSRRTAPAAGADPCRRRRRTVPSNTCVDRALQPVAREPERDQRVVVRPDRAVVIRHRIVARLAARDGADAPAREELRAEQVVRDLGRALRPRDAGEQHLPGIRGARRGTAACRRRARAHRCSISGHQNAASKRSRELCGLRVRACAPARSRPSCRAQRAATLLGGIDVALHLGERDRPFGEPAVGVEDRVVRILPALVGEPLLGRRGSIRRSRRDRDRPDRRSRRARPRSRATARRCVAIVAGALGVEAGEQHEQRRRIDAAVVEPERHLAQRRHLAAAHLVQDLARLGVGAPDRRVLAWNAASRRSTPRAMPGSHHSICSAVIRPSRPNVVEYQGMPA